jgi:hypothetical protein
MLVRKKKKKKKERRRKKKKKCGGEKHKLKPVEVSLEGLLPILLKTEPAICQMIVKRFEELLVMQSMLALLW